MNFDWSPEQSELYARTRHFAEAVLGRDVIARDQAHAFSRADWDACGDHGLLALSVPRADGGLGLDALTTARTIEALGRGCEDTGLVFSICAHLFAAAMPVAEHGNEALRARVLPDMSTGACIGANAISEAEAGSDVYALKTRARRDGDGYWLDGVKSYVTNAPVADVFLVYATANPDWGHMGISAFLVERDRPGLRVGTPFQKMGLTTSPVASVYLDECWVPAHNRVGDEGSGARIFRASMMWERACLFAAYVGTMERQLEQVIDYAQQRRQFGRKLGRHQAVAHRIADMKLRLEAARLLLYRACWARDRGEEAVLEVSLAKLAISEAAIQSSLDAIQLHGGLGVITDAGVERALRDAIPSRIFSGTSEIQRDLIAHSLGL